MIKRNQLHHRKPLRPPRRARFSRPASRAAIFFPGFFASRSTLSLDGLSEMEVLSQPMISEDLPECCEELVIRLDILRRNESFCDVKVVVKDEEFVAHKAVLAAASPFFLSLLLSDMRESKEHLIRIGLEEATASVMEDVLQYVYTGNVWVTEENAHNLMATADYLLLPGLKTAAGRYLTENLVIGNCISYYYFADKYQCEEMKEEARDMINSHFSAVMETDDFLSLDIKQVTEWVSSDDITINTEEEVFKGIVKWVSHNKSEREADFPGLLHQVRLVSISHDFLLNELVKEELVATNSVVCLNFVLDAIRLTVSATAGQVIQKPRKCLETRMDAIFVCGGKVSLCYFPKQNLWYQLSNMISAHDCSHSPAQCREKVYIPCSKWDNQGECLMEFYIPTTNSYSTVHLGTTFICTAVLKGFLYATCTCEGFTRDWVIYRYDPEKNFCDKLKAQPTLRRETCFVSDEQYLYTIGGISYGQYQSTTERFDPNANKWEEVAPINQARSSAFGASMNGKVYIAGGRQQHGDISSCEVYNPVTNEWHLMASLREPRRCASMIHYEGSLYVLGGFRTVYQPRARNRWSDSGTLSVEIFHSEENEWKKATDIPFHCIETSKEEDNEKNQFKACFARLSKGVIGKLKPLNT